MERYVAVPCSAERVELGEGARWDGVGRRLLWVDVPTGRLFCAEFRDGRLVTTVTHQVPGYLTAVAPLDPPGGGWIIAAHEGFAHLAADGTHTVLAEPEAGRRGRTRMNDGACDPAGRFWAGSMAYDSAPGAGSLYRYDGAGRYSRVLGGVSISNGIGWSPDGTRMYYADSGTQTISVFDYDVEVAARQPSCCALGGPEGRHLFITTARAGLPAGTLAAEPDTGRVFVTEVPVPGPPVRPCRAPGLAAWPERRITP